MESVTAVLRQNVIRAENGASPCRKRLSESRELTQGCSAAPKILSGSKPRLCAAHVYKDRVRAAVSERYGWESGSPIVTMMQPAESLMRQDATRGSGTSSKIRRCLPETKMRAVVMVVVDVVSEQTLQMEFVKCDDVIQELAAATAYPTLRNSVLPRAPQRSADGTHLQRSNGYGDLQPVFRIAVENEKPGSRFERKRLSQLLDDPRTRGVRSNVEVQNAPPVMVDDEKAIKHPESDRWGREEIHCGNRFPVVAKESEPTLGWLGISRRPFHPTGDRSLGNIKTQHEELAMDARCSPSWVLGNHPEDQLPHFFRRRPSPNARPGFGDQPPVQTESGPVPADYGFGRDDDEGVPPGRPNPPNYHPEEPIEQADARVGMPTLQHGELLA